MGSTDPGPSPGLPGRARDRATSTRGFPSPRSPRDPAGRVADRRGPCRGRWPQWRPRSPRPSGEPAFSEQPVGVRVTGRHGQGDVVRGLPVQALREDVRVVLAERSEAKTVVPRCPEPPTIGFAAPSGSPRSSRPAQNSRTAPSTTLLTGPSTRKPSRHATRRDPKLPTIACQNATVRTGVECVLNGQPECAHRHALAASRRVSGERDLDGAVSAPAVPRQTREPALVPDRPRRPLAGRPLPTGPLDELARVVTGVPLPQGGPPEGLGVRALLVDPLDVVHGHDAKGHRPVGQGGGDGGRRHTGQPTNRSATAATDLTEPAYRSTRWVRCQVTV
jgi:hypothetical protein